jgi:hypothetical protein
MFVLASSRSWRFIASLARRFWLRAGWQFKKKLFDFNWSYIVVLQAKLLILNNIDIPTRPTNHYVAKTIFAWVWRNLGWQGMSASLHLIRALYLEARPLATSVEAAISHIFVYSYWLPFMPKLCLFQWQCGGTQGAYGFFMSFIHRDHFLYPFVERAFRDPNGTCCAILERGNIKK